MNGIELLLDKSDCAPGIKVADSLGYNLETFGHVVKLIHSEPDALSHDDVVMAYVGLGRYITKEKIKHLRFDILLSVLREYFEDWVKDRQGTELKQ